MAIAGTLLLVFVSLMRPQESFPALQSIPLLDICAALALLGLAVELVTGRERLTSTPQIPWLIAFVVWSTLVTFRWLKLPGLSLSWEAVGLSAIFMLLVTYSARTLRRFKWVAALMVGVGVLLSSVCVHQAQQPLQCIVLDPNDEHGDGTPDGRECTSAWECDRYGEKQHVSYACERVGLLGTFTEGHRVRWRGTLGDPNELALVLGTFLPFAFAFAVTAKRKRVANIAMVAVAGLSLLTMVLTESRGGQLVILTVFGVYFVRRYGFRGLLVGSMCAMPVLLFGGRSGAEADSSSMERIDLLFEGMDMIRAHPIIGVGVEQFMDNTSNGLTAHNSYVLAAAELGLPGSFLWMMLVYTSMKIPITVVAKTPLGLDAAIPPFAMALATSYAGALVGVFFLSFCYKAVLFMFFGLSGALYGMVRKECPDFRIKISLKEALGVAVADVGVLVFVFLFSHYKEAHGG